MERGYYDAPGLPRVTRTVVIIQNFNENIFRLNVQIATFRALKSDHSDFIQKILMENA